METEQILNPSYSLHQSLRLIALYSFVIILIETVVNYMH